MGAKDSKPSFITYEDAVKRVSDSESRRIREAFKRCAGANGTALSLEAFVREVLCDGVPHEVAEWLYQACGGTKRGITFKDLLCGIVVLTKGTLEEKIKFLWTLYVNNQSDNGTYMYRRDFTNALHFENLSLPVSGIEKTGEILTSLFGSGDKVTFEQFRSWLLMHKDATVLSKWLLSERANAVQDLETPTFYQSLAGVTHLEERDIIELEKCFWSLRNTAATGQLDIESLTPLLTPPLPRAAVAGFFGALDENRDGHVDFKELCCGLSAACRGPRAERLKFCFKIFDVDRDGLLNKRELVDMVNVLCTTANESIRNSSRASTPSEGSETEGLDKGFDPGIVLNALRQKLVTAPSPRQPLFRLGAATGGGAGGGEGHTLSAHTETPLNNEDDISPDTVLTLEDFLIWSVESADGLVAPFLALVFELCHIVLGLRPHCRHHERDIVMGWLRREVSRGYCVGQFWYLVGAEWWATWLAHCSAPANCCRLQSRPHDDVIATDESFTSNSTESMGSLLWRAETASVGSAGSSSGVSSAAAHRTAPRAPPPGPVDNKRLLAPNTLKVRTLTGEGGHLRRDITLSQHRDFELVPDALWRALALWYGAPDPLPRQVIRPPNSDVELELYPLHLKLYRHVASPHRLSIVSAGGGVGVGRADVSMYSSVPLAPAPPERQLAYTAAFSRLATVRQVSEFLCQALGLAREDMRLWSLSGSHAVLLDDDRPTLEALRCGERTRLLIEVRNADLTWPEEIGALSLVGSGSRATERRETLTAPNLPGATGLHNLGNTCFMNAALQSVWNTGPLTRYFNSGMHLYEVNTTNPLGTKGALALRYGELCKEVWSCSARSVAPLRVRWCVSRHARHLAGGQQHDAQELLAWLLDTLHEDLNRAADTPPPALTHHRDSNGRPDQEVASEAWEAYTARNKSIITDLFYGQLKSKVRCDTCTRDSVRFDAFNMLSLPLPQESYVCVRADLRVILQDGSVPVKYGVRVNSEGTYLDLKKALSELCGLPPESMLLVELNGATIGRVFQDNAKISAASAGSLYVYEIPREERDSDSSDCDDHMHHADMNGDAACSEDCSAAEGCAQGEVSVGRSASSLCMPALFCFQRSQSEVLMSQSPPGTFCPNGYRATTLPRDLSQLKRLESNGNSSPTLSVKSLNLKPSSPRPGFRLGPQVGALGPTVDPNAPPPNCLFAVHRKQSRSDAYFLPSQRSRPALFGVPLLVGLRHGMSGRDVYAAVWTQVMRLLSARPASDQHNHATDCDDSLGYEYPFTLRVVSSAGGGRWCGVCPWPAHCRGCALSPDTLPLVYTRHNGSTPRPRARARSSASRSTIDSGAPDCNSPTLRTKLQHQHSRLSGNGEESPGVLQRLELTPRSAYRRGVMLAIDWDPTALHLRYQSTREKAWIEHPSVAECIAEASRPIDLASCLKAFTSSEQLEQRYHCAVCNSAQPATKYLQIWRAPPILIIHLKRFQYVNNKWIKSGKVVNFPYQDFDPTDYLAAVPQETIIRYREVMQQNHRGSLYVDGGLPEAISESEESDDDTLESHTKDIGPKRCVNNRTEAHNGPTDPHRVPPDSAKRRESMEIRTRQRLQSSSLAMSPVSEHNLEDFHQHRLQPHHQPLDLKYRLYAVVSHSGQLSGGHYVAYARNPSGTWLCYNDSMCRELSANRGQPPIDPASAYLLFYERQGLDYESYLPDIAGREPVVRDSDSLDPDESDLKKMCTIM